MGIFNFFKKKQGDKQHISEPVSNQSKQHISKPERENIVKVQPVTEGNHGDHWAGLYGFDLFYKDDTIGSEMLAAIMGTGEESTINSDFIKIEIDRPDLKLSAILSKDEMQTAYPIIKSNTIVPVKTQFIKEWQHVNGIEAQVEARGKNTFGISFFATDYLENKEAYTTLHDHEVELSGIVFSATAPPVMEDMAEDFVGYMPSTEYGQFSVMDYVGKILDLKEVNEPDLKIEGYIAKLRLIQMDEDKDFFVITVFISKNNIDLPQIQNGDRISGTMWVQGKLK